jgi:enediyne biosynthesis protein E4
MPELVVDSKVRTGKKKRQGLLLLTAAIITSAALWSGWKWRENLLERLAIAEVKDDLAKGLNALAARKLAAILGRNAGSDQGNYLLGTCEKARGRPDEAVKAWATVPPDSPFAPQAIRARVELEIERGRLADAEQIVIDAQKLPRIDGSGLGLFLGAIYGFQGRLDEAQRFVEMRWEHLNGMGQGASEQAIQLGRLSNELSLKEVPVEAIRAFLDQAAASAPNDDRIWLGRANLAIRVGAYDEAERWLDACQKRRPQDVPVWRARLNLALATDRVAAAKSALEHLPARESTEAQVQRLTAWLAALNANVERERQALERLIAADPGDSAAYDRLAELADKRGQSLDAAEWRRKRNEIDQIKVRYQKRFERNQPLRDAIEMARLAEQLGRWFESRVFLAVASVVDPERRELRDDLERVTQHLRPAAMDDRSLAALLADELNGVRDARPGDRLNDDPRSAHLSGPGCWDMMITSTRWGPQRRARSDAYPPNQNPKRPLNPVA